MSARRGGAAGRAGHLLRAGLLLAGALCATVPARAVLGGDAASVMGDQLRLQGGRRQALAVPAVVPVAPVELTLADGSTIREFISPAGVVFAVSWRTRFRPDLAALFGAYAPDFAVAAHAAMRTPGLKRNLVLTQGDLVVHSAIRAGWFVGQAHAVSLVPQGVVVDALR